jgi:hypothetical protein
MCTSFSVEAQLRYLNLEEHDDKRFHFGILLGVNKSHYNFTRHSSFVTNDSIKGIESINSTGVNLAWLVNLRIGNHLSLRTYPINLVFTGKAFQYYLPTPNTGIGEKELFIKKVQGITLSLPLQLKFTSDRINNLKVYMFGGGKIEYDMAANKGKKNAEGMIKLNKIDYGIEGGIGFHIYFPVFVLSPELKLGYGLRNVHVRDETYKYSSVLDKINARTITISLTVE